MVADALKAPAITALDATPVVQGASGQGAPGALKSINDFVTPTAAGLADTTSKYKMVRVPTNAKLKHIFLTADANLDSNASPTLTVDVGLYYSDSTNDTTAPANQGVVVSGATALFVSNVAFGKGTAASPLVLEGLSSFGQANRNKALWDAAGLASDPGGYFDIVVAVHTGAATGVSNPMGLEAQYVW